MKKIETSVFASGLLCFKAFFEGILSLSDRNCTINSVFVIEGRKEMALNLTKENFEAEVLKSDKPVLVDFFATWCGPCKMVLPLVEEITDEVKDIAKVCKVNIDEQPELTQSFGVMSVPTIMVFKGGEVVNKHVGALSKSALLDLINKA